MFEVVGALFSMFVQFFFPINKFKTNKLGCEHSKAFRVRFTGFKVIFFCLKKQKQLWWGCERVQSKENKKDLWFLGFFSSCQHKDTHRVHFWVCKKGVGNEKFFGDW